MITPQTIKELVPLARVRPVCLCDLVSHRARVNQ
jgi:hypothetical protein